MLLFRWDLGSRAHEGACGSLNLGCDLGLSRIMLTNSAPLPRHMQSQTMTWPPTPFPPRELVGRHCSYVISLNLIFPTDLGEKYITLPVLQMNKPRLREFEPTCCSHRTRKHQCWDSIQTYNFVHPILSGFSTFHPFPRSTPVCIVYVALKVIRLTDVNSHANVPLCPASQGMPHKL